MPEPTSPTTSPTTTPSSNTPPATPPATPQATPQATPPATPQATWLPDDLKTHEKLQSFKSPEDLARHYATLQIPEAPETYAVPQNQVVPETVIARAKELKLSQDQFNGMVSEVAELQKKELETLDTTFKTGLKTLTKEWGDQAKANVQAAQEAVKYVDETGELSKLLASTRQGNNPVIVKAFVKIGRLLKEGGFLRTPSGGPSTPKSKAAAIFPNHPTGN